MNSLKRWLRKWLNSDRDYGLARASTQSPVDELANMSTSVRFSITPALNGKAILVSTYKPNPHGPDWTTQLYLVPEGTSLVEAITTCITLTELSK